MKSFLGASINDKSIRDLEQGLLRIMLKYVPGYDLTRSGNFLDMQINSDESKMAVFTGSEWLEIDPDGSSGQADAHLRELLSAVSPITYNSATGVIGLTASAILGYFSGTAPITYDSATGAIGLSYNTGNLKVTTGALNTIQNIDTLADIKFNSITGGNSYLTLKANATSSIEFVIADDGGNPAFISHGMNSRTKAFFGYHYLHNYFLTIGEVGTGSFTIYGMYGVDALGFGMGSLGSVINYDNTKGVYFLSLGSLVVSINGTGQILSHIATGTSPFAVTSTTVNTNLNADLWDGYQFSDYLDQAVKQASSPTFAGLTLTAFAGALSATAGVVSAGTLGVAYGGTGATTLTDHGILLGSGAGAITPLGAATNGQIPIGSTGADPVLAALTGTANRITVTNGAGSITLTIPDSPSLAGLTLTGLTGVLTGNGVGAITASTGTQNYVMKWGASNAVGSSLIYDTGTGVVIGNTAAASLFELYSASASPVLTITGAHATDYDPTIAFKTDASPTIKGLITLDSTDDSLHIDIGSSMGTTFVINPAGEIGIGGSILSGTRVSAHQSSIIAYPNSLFFDTDLTFPDASVSSYAVGVYGRCQAKVATGSVTTTALVGIELYSYYRDDAGTYGGRIGSSKGGIFYYGMRSGAATSTMVTVTGLELRGYRKQAITTYYDILVSEQDNTTVPTNDYMLYSTREARSWMAGILCIGGAAADLAKFKTNGSAGLHIYNDLAASTANDGDVLWLSAKGNQTTNKPTIIFNQAGSTGSNLGVWRTAEIQCFATGAVDFRGDIAFRVNTGASATAVSEKMRLDYLGNLKIGNTTVRGTTESSNALVLFNGTAPSGTLANGFSFYANGGYGKMMDAAGLASHVLGASAINSVSPTSPNRTITVNIGGTTLYIAAKTTND